MMSQLEIASGLAVLLVLYHVTKWVRRPRELGYHPVQVLRTHRERPSSVSFLVPAWNAEDAIPAFVASFKRLKIRNKQLILCAGGRDTSYKVAKAFESSKVKVIEQQPGMGKQRALHLSLSSAAGEVVFLTDIDCHLDNDAVLRLLCQLSGTRSVVTGGIRPLQQQNRPLVTLQWAIRRAVSPRDIRETDGLLGANTALFKSVLDAIGGFAAEAKTGTDYTLAKELMAKGYKIWYVPDCEMATEFPDKLTTYIHKQSRWLRNILVIGPKYHAWSELRSVLTTLLLPYLYLALVIGGFFLPVLWIVFLLLMIHATLNRIRYVSMWKQTVPVSAAFISILGDLAAAAQAGYQWVFRKYVW